MARTDCGWCVAVGLPDAEDCSGEAPQGLCGLVRVRSRRDAELLRDAVAQTADDVCARTVGVQVGRQLAEVLAMADVGCGVVDEVVNVGGFEFGQLRIAGGAIEQDRRQWIGEVICDEAVGAVAFASGPVSGG